MLRVVMPAARRGVPSWLGAALVLAGIAACQPVDEPLPDVGDEGSPVPDEATEAVGAPDETVPGDLPGLAARADPEAERWQPAPRPAEATVRLDDRAWTEASVTYVAPGAESALVVRIDEAGLSTERVSFDTLGLEPLPEHAVEELPDLVGLTAPADLATAAEDHFGDCGASAPGREVRLATGAPATWDGDGWAQRPQWRAAVTDAEGLGVRLDAATGELADDHQCVDAAWLETPEADPGDEPEGGPGADPDESLGGAGPHDTD